MLLNAFIIVWRESLEAMLVIGITMGVLAGRPNLSPSDEATFNGMADKLKLRE